MIITQRPPGRGEASNCWNSLTPPEVLDLLQLLGWNPGNEQLLDANTGDFTVHRNSAVDGNLDNNGSPIDPAFQSTEKTDHNHTDVGNSASVGDTLIELLDLEYDKPTSAGYTLGATFFNDGM